MLEPVGGEALGFAVSGASAEGLTIRPARAGNDGESWSAVAVHNVEATVEGCLLSTPPRRHGLGRGTQLERPAPRLHHHGRSPERRLGLRGGASQGRRQPHRRQPLARDGGRRPCRPRDHGLRARRQPRRGRRRRRRGAPRHRGLHGVGQRRDRDPAGGRGTLVPGRGLHRGAQQRRGHPGRGHPRLCRAPQPRPRQRRRHRRARWGQPPGGGQRPRRQRDRHRRPRPGHEPGRRRQHRGRDAPHRGRRGRGGAGPLRGQHRLRCRWRRHLGRRRGLGARLLGQPGLGQRRRRGARDGRRRRPLPVERPARQRRAAPGSWTGRATSSAPGTSRTRDERRWTCWTCRTCRTGPPGRPAG